MPEIDEAIVGGDVRAAVKVFEEVLLALDGIQMTIASAMDGGLRIFRFSESRSPTSMPVCENSFIHCSLTTSRTHRGRYGRTCLGTSSKWSAVVACRRRLARRKDHPAVGLRVLGLDGGVGGRIPDLVVWSKAPAQPRAVWLPVDGVLLVVEIISVGPKAVDTVTTRDEYAGAGIVQYWTVARDASQTVTMYRLAHDGRVGSARSPD